MQMEQGVVRFVKMLPDSPIDVGCLAGSLRDQKLRRSHDLATPLFEKNLRGHVRTVPGNMHVKVEVCPPLFPSIPPFSLPNTHISPP